MWQFVSTEKGTADEIQTEPPTRSWSILWATACQKKLDALATKKYTVLCLETVGKTR